MTRQQYRVSAEGPAPGTVRVRLAGAGCDLGVVASILAKAGVEVVEQSAPRSRRDGAGSHLYMVIRLADERPGMPGGSMTDEEWVRFLYGARWDIGFVVDHWYAVRATLGSPAVLRAPTPGQLWQLIKEAEQPRRPEHGGYRPGRNGEAAS